MPVSKALRRLLQVRALEEEQDKAALESALGDLRRLENALGVAKDRARAGRACLTSGAHSPDPLDRIAGLVEAEAGGRASQLLSQRVSAAGARTAALREEYLEKRVERRQADTVIREAEELETVEQARRQQQNVDEWFGVRRHAASADYLAAQIPATGRPPSEKHEIKDNQECSAVPEAELRTNL